MGVALLPLAQILTALGFLVARTRKLDCLERAHAPPSAPEALGQRARTGRSLRQHRRQAGPSGPADWRRGNAQPQQEQEGRAGASALLLARMQVLSGLIGAGGYGGPTGALGLTKPEPVGSRRWHASKRIVPSCCRSVCLGADATGPALRILFRARGRSPCDHPADRPAAVLRRAAGSAGHLLPPPRRRAGPRAPGIHPAARLLQRAQHRDGA